MADEANPISLTGRERRKARINRRTVQFTGDEVAKRHHEDTPEETGTSAPVLPTLQEREIVKEQKVSAGERNRQLTSELLEQQAAHRALNSANLKQISSLKLAANQAHKEHKQLTKQITETLSTVELSEVKNTIGEFNTALIDANRTIAILTDKLNNKETENKELHHRLAAKESTADYVSTAQYNEIKMLREASEAADERNRDLLQRLTEQSVQQQDELARIMELKEKESNNLAASEKLRKQEKERLTMHIAMMEAGTDVATSSLSRALSALETEEIKLKQHISNLELAHDSLERKYDQVTQAKSQQLGSQQLDYMGTIASLESRIHALQVDQQRLTQLAAGKSVALETEITAKLKAETQDEVAALRRAKKTHQQQLAAVEDANKQHLEVLENHIHMLELEAEPAVVALSQELKKQEEAVAYFSGVLSSKIDLEAKCEEIVQQKTQQLEEQKELYTSSINALENQLHEAQLENHLLEFEASKPSKGTVKDSGNGQSETEKGVLPEGLSISDKILACEVVRFLSKTLYIYYKETPTSTRITTRITLCNIYIIYTILFTAHNPANPCLVQVQDHIRVIEEKHVEALEQEAVRGETRVKALEAEVETHVKAQKHQNITHGREKVIK